MIARLPLDAGAAFAPPPLEDRDFARFQALVYGEAGIHLTAAKKALLVGRLSKRLRELGVDSYAAYYERVLADPAERVQMLDRITTNETHFFREPRHFRFLVDQVFPQWKAEADAGRRPRRLRIWSAGCSTGEEPYSIAMALLDAFPAGSGWDLQVLGTDLSTRVLARARAAVWPIAQAEEIPEADRKAHMLRGVGRQEGLMKAGPELRGLVRLDRLNLAGDAWPRLGPFDAVFCRNVLIYFDAPTKERVVGRLLERVEVGGYLFVGHAESLSGMPHAVRTPQATIYVRGGAVAQASGGAR